MPHVLCVVVLQHDRMYLSPKISACPGGKTSNTWFAEILSGKQKSWVEWPMLFQMPDTELATAMLYGMSR